MIVQIFDSWAGIYHKDYKIIVMTKSKIVNFVKIKNTSNLFSKGIKENIKI